MNTVIQKAYKVDGVWVIPTRVRNHWRLLALGRLRQLIRAATAAIILVQAVQYIPDYSYHQEDTQRRQQQQYRQLLEENRWQQQQWHNQLQEQNDRLEQMQNEDRAWRNRQRWGE